MFWALYKSAFIIYYYLFIIYLSAWFLKCELAMHNVKPIKWGNYILSNKSCWWNKKITQSKIQNKNSHSRHQWRLEELGAEGWSVWALPFPMVLLRQVKRAVEKLLFYSVNLTLNDLLLLMDSNALDLFSILSVMWSLQPWPKVLGICSRFFPLPSPMFNVDIILASDLETEDGMEEIYGQYPN